MAELMHEFRGGLLENIHHGRIAVVDDKGGLLYAVGDPDALTYFRSASKPLQTLPVIERGLGEHYGLTDAEMVIMAGSHVGEPMHLAAVLGILEKTGYKEEDMVMLPALPFDKSAREEMVKNGKPPRKALHNCAGKHSAAMILAEALGGSHLDYWQPDSAAQKAIAACIGEMAEWPPEKMELGIDGCGVPVFAVPLQNIAKSYMRLACPDRIERPELRRAVERLAVLIHKENLMMRGTGYLCSVFNEDPNVVAKGGAKGVYGFGLKKERIGVALKIEDGTEETWPNILAEILRQLHYSNLETIQKLDELSSRKLLNDNQTEVGETYPVFHLKTP